MGKKIRVVTRDNGVGLSRDLHLVAGVLRAGGYDVTEFGFGGSKGVNRLRELQLLLTAALGGRVDVQVSLERVYEHTFPSARRHLFVPNPEWFLPKWECQLPRFERVLCKTRHAVEIFERLGCKTRYIGFTSDDRHDPNVPRERAFFHLAGRSSAKGTQAVLDAWRRNPQWPRLTVVQAASKARPVPGFANIDHRVGYLDDAELRRLQNACFFHVCPSEMEGYGHYLVEALSVGAVVLTTDAAPMNELVTPERGLLLACTPGQMHGLDRRHHVPVEAIEAGVERALAMDQAACDALSTAARGFFHDNDRAFRERLVQALAE